MRCHARSTRSDTMLGDCIAVISSPRPLSAPLARCAAPARALRLAVMRLSIAGAAALSFGAASAVPVASASAGPLQFEIVDLRPEDGVPAGYRLDRRAHPPAGGFGQWATSVVLVEDYNDPRDFVAAHRLLESDPAFLAPNSVALSEVRSLTTAVIADDTLSVSASTRSFGATSAVAQSDIWYFLDAPPPGYFGLELAPYTAATLSFAALLRIADGGITAGENEHAEAVVTFVVDAVPDTAGGSPPGGQLQVEQRILRSRNVGRQDERELAETLSLTLTNDSDRIMHGSVNLQTAALTWIGPAPIPEPSTVALGLVGGLTLLVLRKRTAGASS